MNIHLAGMEHIHFTRVVCASGHKFGLCSYFYLTSLNSDILAEQVDMINRSEISMILDSGIFSMMFGAESGRAYDLQFMLDYAHKYIAFAKKLGIKNLISVEMDAHKILGMEAVFELRKLFKDAGIPTMYVWHIEEGIDGLLKLATEEKHIAIGAPELRKFFKGKHIGYKTGIFSLLAKIERRCIVAGVPLPKIHILGNTVEATMRTRVGFSCDSTSWIAGVKYGGAMVYQNGRLLKVHLRSKAFLDLKAQIEATRPEFIEMLDRTYDSPKRRDYYLSLFVSADSYRKYQQWLDTHYTWKGNSWPV